MGTLIVGVILGLIVFAIIRYLLKELKSGKSLYPDITPEQPFERRNVIR